MVSDLWHWAEMSELSTPGVGRRLRSQTPFFCAPPLERIIMWGKCYTGMFGMGEAWAHWTLLPMCTIQPYPSHSVRPYTEVASELAATATATAVAKGAAKDALYVNAWWRGDPAAAIAVAANLDTAWASFYSRPFWNAAAELNRLWFNFDQHGLSCSWCIDKHYQSWPHFFSYINKLLFRVL